MAICLPRSIFQHLVLLSLLLLVLFTAASPAPAQMTTGSIHLTVTDSDGSPLPGVVISAAGAGQHRTTVSNAMGRARLLMLPVGSYQLSAGMQGFKTWTASAMVSLGQATSVSLTLQVAQVDPDLTVHSQPLSAVPLAGSSSEYGQLKVVLSGVSGPLAGAALQLGGVDLLRFKSTDADGTALFTLVPPGRYYIIITAAGYLSLVRTSVEVFSSQTATLTAQMSPLYPDMAQTAAESSAAPSSLVQTPLAAVNNRGRIEFNVFGPGGVPASGAVCLAVGGGGIHVDFTDSVGLTQFNGLTYGSYFLHVHQDGAEDWFSEYQLDQALPDPVQVFLQTPAADSGADSATESGGLILTLLDSNGSPASYDTVYLVNHDQQQLIFGATDSGGQAAFPALIPGKWYVFAQRMNPETITITAGQTLEITGVIGD